MIDKRKIELFIEDFYKDLSNVRLDKWNYEDGCILIAAIQLYEATGKDKFKNFIIDYVNAYVTEDGIIKNYSMEDYNLDNLASGRGLIFAYEQTKEERYLQAIQKLEAQIKNQPRTISGNFWHKKIYPYQVWLDGLFMAQPFYMECETKFGKKEHYRDILKQFKGVRTHMFDEKKQLYYHGYDESLQVFWANKITGCSKNFWLRSIAWYQIAMIDTMEEMSKAIYEQYQELEDLFKEALKGVLNYQDKDSKLFYQVIDLPDLAGNYLETSGSAMLAASIIKACRMKVILAEKYFKTGEEILDAIINQKLIEMDGKLILKDTCLVAGLGPKDNLRRDGSVEYYLSEPVGNDDRKGIAALFMAYAQYLKYMDLV